jgi:hypothetical protein
LLAFFFLTCSERPTFQILRTALPLTFRHQAKLKTLGIMRSLACLFARGANPLSSFTTNVSRILFLCVTLVVFKTADAQNQLTFNLQAAVYTTSSVNSSGNSGFDQPLVGSLYRATTGTSTSTVATGQSACGGSTASYGTGSSLFIFYTANAITNLTVNGTSTAGTRTLSAVTTSTSLTGTYTALANSAGASTIGASCGSLTLNPTATIPAGTFIKITLSGNINIFSVIVTTQNPFYFYGGSSSSDISNPLAWWSGYDVLTGLGSTGGHPSMSATNTTFVVQNSTTAPTLSTGLSLGSGSKIVVGGAFSNSATLTIPSTQTVTGTVDVQNNGTLAIANTTNPTLGTLSSGSTVSFTGSSSQTIPSKTYSNLTVNNSTGATLASTATVSSNLTLSNGALSGGTSLTIAAAATITRSAGSLAATPTFGTTVNVTYTNTGNITAGVEIPTTTSVLSALSTLGGTAGTAVTLDANVTANGAVLVNGSNLAINTGKTLTLASASTLTVTTGKIDVTGTLVNQATASITLTPSNAITVNSGGTYVHNTAGGISTPLAKMSLDNNSTFIYRGSSSLNTSVSIAGKSYGNLTFESSSGSWTPTLSGASALTVNGALSIGGSGAGTFSTGTGFTGAITVSSNLTIATGSTLGATTNAISVGGNWNQSGTYSATANTVTFNGGSQQQYTRTGTGNLVGLTLNNSNGLLLNNALTASGTLTLTSGRITLGANDLTLSGSTAISGPAFGTTSSSYIVASNTAGGKLIIQNIGLTGKTGDVLFPVGADDLSYNPIVINTGATTTNTFAVNVISAPVGGVVSAKSVQKSWSVTRSTGTSAAIVKAQWTATDEGGSFVRASSQVVDYNGTALDGVGTIAAASGIDPYTQTSAITFSAFSTIGVTKGTVTTQFYNAPSSDVTLLASWGTNTDGSGTNPTDFISDDQQFNITNSNAFMSGVWTVSGTGSSIAVGDGTAAFTFVQDFDITGPVSVKNNATLQIVTDNAPTFGTLSSGSTVEYAGNTQSITAANYYNLKLSGSGSRNFPAGTVAVAGTFIPASFTSASAGTISFNGTAQAIPVFNYNNLTLAGTGTTFPVGIVGIGGAFTNGSISSASQGTISYNGSVAQSLTAFNYNNLTLAGSGTRSFPTGTVGIAGAFVPTTFTTATQGTISYNGTSAQTVAGFNYAALSCNNSAGTSIGAGNTASITSLTIPAGKLTVNGTLENVNTGATVISSTTTNLEFSSTGTYKLSAAPGAGSSATQIPTATWTDSSTLYLALGTSATGDYNNLQGVKQTFSNVVINNGAFAGKLVLPFNTNGGNTAPFLIISGRLSVLSTGVGTSSLQLINSAKNNNALAMNSYQQTSGTVYVAGSTSSANNRVVTVAGDVYIDGGTFYVLNANGGSSTNIGTLNVGGNLVLASGATMIKDGTAAAVGNLQFSSTTANQTFTNNGTFTGPINVNINNTFGRVNLAGDLAISGSLALTAGTFDIDVNTLTLQGTTTRTAGAIDADNGLLVLNGTSAQTLPANAIVAGNIKSLTVNNSAGATLTGNHTIGNTLTLTSGALAMSTGMTLTMGNNSDIIRIAGSLSAAPVFTSLVDVRYQNIGALTTGNELPANDANIKSLMIEASGGNSVSLGRSVVINGDLTLTSGKLVLGGNDLSVNSITQNSTSSWVATDGIGALKVMNLAASTTQLFPVGASTSSYSPLSVAPSAAAQDWSVRVAPGVQPSVGVWYSNDAVQRTWNVTPYTAGSSTALTTATAEMTFQWDVSNTGMLSSNSAWDGNSATAIVNHYTGTNWETAGGTLTAGGTSPEYTLKLAYSGSFSPFAISKSTMPLPVTLLSFTGKRMNGANELKWITATESGNRGFAVERSIDGRSYTQVGFVVTRAAGGNSTSELAYSFRDNAAGTKWYYRLKQTDIDGKSKYSNVVTLSSDKSGMLVLDGVYPNPAQSNIQVRVQAAANSNGLVLQLSDMQGRIVKLKQVSLEAGASTTVSMELTGLAAGVYHLKAVSSDGTVSETTTLVKQ